MEIWLQTKLTHLGFLLAMTSFIQAGAVEGLSTALTLVTFALDLVALKDVLNIKFSSGNVIPLTRSPTPFFIRSNWQDSHRQVNVFGPKGNQLYSFERLSRFNPVWTLNTYPHRKEVATVDIGVRSSTFEFHNKSGLNKRKIQSDLGFSGYNKSFYTDDGVKYTWSRSNKFLEKIINPNGGSEEHRERIAKVKLMRQFKFDFELLVDEDKMDAEIALVSAFVSMMTQWGVGEYTNTVGPSFIEPAVEVIPQESQENEITLVIER